LKTPTPTPIPITKTKRPSKGLRTHLRRVKQIERKESIPVNPKK